MIRSLRQRHRQIVAVLGIMLPIAFAAGLAARKPISVMNSISDLSGAKTIPFQNQEWRRADLFSNSPVQVHLLRERAGSGAFAIAFTTITDFLKPDLLVYWANGTLAISNALPDDSTLLGEFSTNDDLPLPAIANATNGVLILYSLGDHAIVDVSKPFSTKNP
jgi:hypothetical protein